MLRGRLAALEREVHEVWQALAEAPGTRLDGMFLLVRAGERRLLLPASTVGEVCPLVASAPVPSRRLWLVGTFLWRGVQAQLIDLACRLSAERSVPRVDAQIVVLIGSTPIGLWVDRVEGLVEGPRVLGAPEERGGDVELFCELDGAPVPLLSPAAPRRWLEEEDG